MKTTIFAAVAILVFAFSNNAFAHSGGTDANGCHTNHKTGEYHCH
ncbi:YHYH domain-containing protein [Mesorhizobium loti]